MEPVANWILKVELRDTGAASRNPIGTGVNEGNREVLHNIFYCASDPTGIVTRTVQIVFRVTGRRVVSFRD
jgi:hypothetical protein